MVSCKKITYVFQNQFYVPFQKINLIINKTIDIILWKAWSNVGAFRKEKK